MNWYIDKECHRCFGQLRIYESNIEFRDRRSCLGHIDYYTTCDNCSGRIYLRETELGQDVREYVLTNFNPTITLSVQPHTIKNEYKMTHLNCHSSHGYYPNLSGSVSHSIINIDNFLVEFSWGVSGVGEYTVYYECPECGVRINLTRIREDTRGSDIPDRYKYAIYQNYRELSYTRRRSRRRRCFLRCLTFQC